MASGASTLTPAAAAAYLSSDEETVLASVQDRVLWLAMSMVHEANHVRSNPSGIKVGGHQASSASMVSIMTALYFRQLRRGDDVSVKPHASPVLHAINYLLGNLDEEYLSTLRAYRGLQSYPSRTKDPDPVDFSTGSVGIGATATIWNALARRYATAHLGVERGARSIALIGDAELDEGAVWEALVDPMVPALGELLWIVDLNRQSLDRVVPDIAELRMEAMFRAAGWDVSAVKYGRRLRAAFEQPGGELLERRLDEMANEEYQSLLRAPADEVRARLLGPAADNALCRLVDEFADEVLQELVADLGGHDLSDLSAAMSRAAQDDSTPSVIFAYTIKAWRLPTRGHPGNHSALLSPEQWRALGDRLGTDPDDPWARFAPGTAEHDLCADVGDRLRRGALAPDDIGDMPVELGRKHLPRCSTQQALGRFLSDLDRVAPDVAERVVTVSPDVASSTNLGGWVNRVGVWNPLDRRDWFDGDPDRLMEWKERPTGRHIELGIAEGNLVGLLAELGATWSRYGRRLLPVGTIYDPFVTRALEPWAFGMYGGGQSILIGTPSGVTLAPEGGAHQSVVTPSVGLAQPGCIAWEPCFAVDLDWSLLAALDRLGTPDGTSAYFRLSTRPIDQSLAAMPPDGAERERRRRHVLAGGYVVRRAATAPDVALVGMGAVMPEVLAAADVLTGDGLAVDVICLTSADLVFRAARSRQGFGDGPTRILDVLFPPERRAPMVTVIDGHPHALAFLAGINATFASHLGVDDFGQSGELGDLQRHFAIDPDTIVGAAWDLFEGPVAPDMLGG